MILKGDSGGPLTHKSGDQHVLIGDVSWGKSCGKEVSMECMGGSLTSDLGLRGRWRSWTPPNFVEVVQLQMKIRKNVGHITI